MARVVSLSLSDHLIASNQNLWLHEEEYSFPPKAEGILCSLEPNHQQEYILWQTGEFEEVLGSISRASICGQEWQEMDLFVIMLL